MQLTNNHSNQGAFFAIHLNQILKCTATVSTSFYFTLKTLKRGFNHTCQQKIIILEGSLIVGFSITHCFELAIHISPYYDPLTWYLYALTGKL